MKTIPHKEQRRRFYYNQFTIVYFIICLFITGCASEKNTAFQEEKAKARYLNDLIQNLNSDIFHKRAKALEAIGHHIEGHNEIEHIIPSLRYKDNSNIRRLAIEALAKIGAPKGIEYIVPVLKDSDFMVRKTAIKALIKLGHPKIIIFLSEALEDKSIVVERYAAEQLIYLEHKNPGTIDKNLYDVAISTEKNTRYKKPNFFKPAFGIGNCSNSINSYQQKG